MVAPIAGRFVTRVGERLIVVIGTASGVYNAMRQVGGAFGIAIASAVFAAVGGFTSPMSWARVLFSWLGATPG